MGLAILVVLSLMLPTQEHVKDYLKILLLSHTFFFLFSFNSISFMCMFVDESMYHLLTSPLLVFLINSRK